MPARSGSTFVSLSFTALEADPSSSQRGRVSRMRALKPSLSAYARWRHRIANIARTGFRASGTDGKEHRGVTDAYEAALSAQGGG